MDKLLKVMGPQARSIRLARDLSMEDVAARVGIKRQQLDRFENAMEALTSDYLMGLSTALNVPLTRLFHDLDRPV